MIAQKAEVVESEKNQKVMGARAVEDNYLTWSTPHRFERLKHGDDVDVTSG